MRAWHNYTNSLYANGPSYRDKWVNPKQSVAHESQPYCYYYVVYMDEVTATHTHTHTHLLYHIDINCQTACERTLAMNLN